MNEWWYDCSLSLRLPPADGKFNYFDQKLREKFDHLLHEWRTSGGPLCRYDNHRYICTTRTTCNAKVDSEAATEHTTNRDVQLCMSAWSFWRNLSARHHNTLPHSTSLLLNHWRFYAFRNRKIDTNKHTKQCRMSPSIVWTQNSLTKSTGTHMNDINHTHTLLLNKRSCTKRKRT